MSKINFSILIILPIITEATSLTITCNPSSTEVWKDKIEVKSCKIETKLLITKPGITIKKCLPPKDYNSSKVNGISIHNKTVNFLPFGFSQCFSNLIALTVESSKLTEIRQDNLKEFPELKLLAMPGNLIKVIEKNLFDFNSKLIYVNLSKNLIKIINSNAFNVLKELNFLDLFNNTCINTSITNFNYSSSIIIENCSKLDNSTKIDDKIEPLMTENVNFKFFVGFTVTAGILTVLKTVLLYIYRKKRLATVEIE